MKIYTDGSCLENPGPGGWAFVESREDRLEIKSDGEYRTTNNRMELTAVIEALSYALENKKSGEIIQIVSDSAYVVNAINKNWLENWKKNGWVTKGLKQVKNKDLWEQLDILLNEMEVEFIKVKGHNGHPLNELVDVKAREQAMVISASLKIGEVKFEKEE